MCYSLICWYFVLMIHICFSFHRKPLKSSSFHIQPNLISSLWRYMPFFSFRCPPSGIMTLLMPNFLFDGVHIFRDLNCFRRAPRKPKLLTPGQSCSLAMRRMKSPRKVLLWRALQCTGLSGSHFGRKALLCDQILSAWDVHCLPDRFAWYSEDIEE